MTNIYLIRHAEAEGNYFRRIQGQWDGGITARGFRQIDALAERMKPIHLDALYSSDLTRTKLTAAAVQKYHDLPLHTDRRLREVAMGVWEGISWGDASWNDHEQYTYFSSNPDLWCVEGAERWSQLQDRIYNAVTDIASRHDGQSIAIVCHGTAIRSLMCRIMGIPGKDIRSVPHGDNTCVSLLNWDGNSLQIVYACDNSHLSADLTNHAKQTWWRTGQDTGNLRFRPLNLQTEARFFLDCYADAWQTTHGNTEGFSAPLYLSSAKKWLDDHPESIAVALDGETAVGIVALDTQRAAHEGRGWIGFLYLLPEHRGKGYGTQLVGYAAALYTRLGRSLLCLSVSRKNTNAQDFYAHQGFTQYDTATGVGAPLYLLERPLSGGVLD